MLTVSEIRKRYPNPKKSQSYNKPSEYCVGGALCLMGGYPVSFPIPSVIASYLRRHNASLTLEKSFDFAENIISLNDHGNFEEAWRVLNEALTFR